MPIMILMIADYVYLHFDFVNLVRVEVRDFTISHDDFQIENSERVQYNV